MYLITKDANDPSEKKVGKARFCPILQKGEEDVFEKTYFRAPLILLDRKTR